MKVLYHGSPNGNIKKLRPSSPGKNQPKAVYATKRKGLATAFSIKGLGWHNIKRKDDKWVIKDVKDKQLDTTGYIYHLKPSEFEKYQGWQYINEEPTKPKKIEKVNIGEELRKLGWERMEHNRKVPMVTPKIPRLR